MLVFSYCLHTAKTHEKKIFLCMLIKFTKELNEIEVCIITIARRIATPAGSSCSEFNETIETVSFICQFEVVRDV